MRVFPVLDNAVGIRHCHGIVFLTLVTGISAVRIAFAFVFVLIRLVRIICVGLAIRVVHARIRIARVSLDVALDAGPSGLATAVVESEAVLTGSVAAVDVGSLGRPAVVFVLAVGVAAGVRAHRRITVPFASDRVVYGV